MTKFKVFTAFLFLTISSSLFGQTVNGIPLKDINVEYVEIVGTSKLFSNDVTIEIDFGQKDKIFKTKDTRIVGADGKDLVFHSMVDALNFMCENGYSFLTAYALTVGNQNVYHFLLQKNDL
jgi:hypothetical protein